MSHDLRTPLASIKASVTSLLAEDVDWPPEVAQQFAATIDQETDRLSALVANLLDRDKNYPDNILSSWAVAGGGLKVGAMRREMPGATAGTCRRPGSYPN